MSSEFNYVKNTNDECVLVPGTSPLPDDEICKDGAEYWYERTPYRQIPYSTCEEGDRPDRGKAHLCPGFSSNLKGFLFWFFILLLPFGFTVLVAYYFFRRSGMARGCVFFFSLFRYFTSYNFLHQNDSTTWRSQQTGLRRRYRGYCYLGFSSLVHHRCYWNRLSMGRV